MTLWVLIVMANIDRGGAGLSIPMQSEQACLKAETTWKGLPRDGWTYQHYAYCLNTENGEIK